MNEIESEEKGTAEPLATIVRQIQSQISQKKIPL